MCLKPGRGQPRSGGRDSASRNHSARRVTLRMMVGAHITCGSNGRIMQRTNVLFFKISMIFFAFTDLNSLNFNKMEAYLLLIIQLGSGAVDGNVTNSLMKN